MRESLPMAILSISARLALRAAEKGTGPDVRRHLRYMRKSGFGSTLMREAIGESLSPTRERIRVLCVSAADQAERCPAAAARVARRVLEGAWPLLAAIDLLVRAGEPLRDVTHDGVAAAVRDCVVAYGNKTEDWKSCLQLSEAALPLAVGRPTHEQIEEDVDQLFANFCGQAAEEAMGDAGRADYVVSQFLSDAQPLLEGLDRLLPESNRVREQAHEHVVTVARNCTIAYGKQTEHWEVCMRLCWQILPLAASEASRDLLRDDIKATTRLAARGARRTGPRSYARPGGGTMGR